LRYQFGLVTDFALQLLMSVWASSDAYRQERWPLYAEPHPEPPKVLWRLLAVMLACVALGVVDFAGIRSLKIRAFKMTAASMAPTIRPGDRVMADMGYYRSHECQDGDVVVLNLPASDRTLLIKRIVASPGETIQGEGEHIYLNGKPVDEPYAVYESHGSTDAKFDP